MSATRNPAPGAAIDSTPLALPRRVRFGRDYWLNRCAGFRVEALAGGRARVEGVVFRSRIDCPDVLLLRREGALVRRTTVRVEEVVEIDVTGGRLLLRTLGTETAGPVSRWLRRARAAFSAA